MINRAALVNRTARALCRAKHGTEQFWTLCISEASQLMSMAAQKRRRLK